MKEIFSTAPFRQGLAVGLLGLFFSGSFYLSASYPPAGRGSAFTQLLENESEEDEANDGDRVFADRPDLALEQDADLTRDPATGTVPRERLLAAAQFNEMQLAQRSQQRLTSGSLAAGTWTERGPSNVGGRTRSLLVDASDPTGNTLWAGAVGGGLWKSTNAKSAAVQWQNVNSYLSKLAVSAIAAVPAAPQVMYCGTGEGFNNIDAIQGAGIWKSTDGGNTWAQLASTANVNFYYVQKIVVHPVTNDVYAATRNGLWRSQNGGATWSAVLSNAVAPTTATARVADLEIGADNTLFASFGIFSTDGIYRSTTGDVASWTKLNTLPGSGLPTTGYQRIELACAPSDANRVYALFQSSAAGYPLLNIFRSMDKGDTWAPMTRPGATAANTTFDFANGQGWYDFAAAVSPTNANTLLVGGLDLWATNNAGDANPTLVTWTHQSFWNVASTSSRFVHADNHVIAFIPTFTGTATQAYFGNDGGVFFGDNVSAAAPAFSPRNTGLNVTQFYAVAMHPSNYNYFLAGAQDNGTQRFTTAGVNATTRATGGDGGFCAIDQLDPTYQFTSYVYNQYYRSVNSGGSFAYYSFSDKKGSFINPFDYDSRMGVLYGAYANDSCLVWTNAGSPDNNATTVLNRVAAGIGKITHITVSPLTRKRIYVGTNTGRVLRVDSASSDTPVTTVLRPAQGGTSVSCIAVDPANESHLLITYSNYGVVSVYETINANATTPTWTNVQGALPDMPVRWALFDPHNTTRALIATEMGVYSTDQLNGSGTVWTLANSTMANTRVDMLRYRAGDQVVAAATHGRGLFTSDVFFTTALPTKSAANTLVTNVYPNPFRSQLSLELGTIPTSPVAVTLSDAMGRRVFGTTLPAGSRQLGLPVPAALAPGSYILTVRSNGQQTSRHLVKE